MQRKRCCKRLLSLQLLLPLNNEERNKKCNARTCSIIAVLVSDCGETGVIVPVLLSLPPNVAAVTGAVTEPSPQIQKYTALSGNSSPFISPHLTEMGMTCKNLLNISQSYKATRTNITEYNTNMLLPQI